ncbi:protein EARLY-RESPONSIVE TO DEHYDRATION 7, chloroplastic-like [Phragmites australis]|uniref:protein EARLY-RESPONSIVE TO DEHYDRATION 7, chloroplastic-like n=1 Tax=Phragmites australis TaxID=29695 RepID=UPI002D7705F8|nr:protein EARLY-RESPONSIVE TO DEHYDRATION 7, chloroplastic-like [Phragmites australis]
MASHNSSTSNPNPNPTPSAPPLYPTLSMADLAPVAIGPTSSPTAADEDNAPPPSEDVLLRLPGTQLHLIDRSRSHPLAAGDLSLLRIRSGDTSLAAIALLPPIQWPLARDVAAVKLDPCHYSFSLTVPASPDDPNPEPLHYGITLSHPDPRLDGLLATCTNFSVHSVVGTKELENRVRDEVEAAAYWTAVAPNVEEYGGAVARAIATGAGHLAKGILWCGVVTVERLHWGNEVLKKRMQPGDTNAEVSPEMLRRIKRAKKVTKMSEKVATGILSGVVKVTGYFTSSVANSKAGKKFFSLLPGEIVLASLDGFGKICDAVEVAGKNVLSTSSTVTTGLVSHKYGDKAAAATNEGLDAAGHAIGTAWAVFKIRQALNPKSVLKPTTLAKSTIKANAAKLRAKHSK